MTARLTYLNYCQLISRYFHYPQFHNGLLVNVILFNVQSLTVDDKEALKDPGQVYDKYTRSKKLLQVGCDEFKDLLGVTKVDQLMHTLAIMHWLTTKTIDQDDQEAADEGFGDYQPATGNELVSVNQLLLVSYDTEEELWLRNQFTLIDNALVSITPGPQLIDLLIQEKNQAIQSPKDFLNYIQIRVNLMHGRFMSLLNIHPELSLLSKTQEQQLVNVNFPLAIFFFASRNIFYSSLVEQFVAILGCEGSYDKDSISRELVGKVNNMKPTGVILDYVPMPAKDKWRFLYLMKELSQYTKDRLTFWLMMLVILLDQPGSGSGPGHDVGVNKRVRDIRQTYHHVFQR